MAKGPNEWEWQVGLATHDGNAADDPVLTGPGTDGTRVKPGSAVTRGPNQPWRSQHPKARLYKPNPVEPPWYVTRMPGGVGGVAPRGVPLSRSSAHPAHCRAVPAKVGLLKREPLLSVVGGNASSCPEADLYVGAWDSLEAAIRQSAAANRSRSLVFTKSKSTGLVMNSAAPYSPARRRRSSSP
jgi:hypothetical protein